jgi:hypothetical protein
MRLRWESKELSVRSERRKTLFGNLRRCRVEIIKG